MHSRCLSALVLLILSVFVLEARTVTVGKIGCDYQRIGEALADGADILLLEDPCYRESGIIIGHDVSIIGKGEKSTIDAAGMGRVFLIEKDVRVTLTDLVITGGQVRDEPACGAGICSYGDLSLLRCVIEGNRAIYGAGITNYSTMEIIRCLIRDNHTLRPSAQAIYWGLGCTGSGGGIKNESGAHLTIRDSEIRENSSLKRGGGLFIACESTVEASSLIFEGNTSNESGAAVHLRGDFMIEDSRFSDNRALNGSGGIHNQGHLDCARLMFEANSPRDYLVGSGGGIYGTGEVGICIDTAQVED